MVDRHTNHPDDFPARDRSQQEKATRRSDMQKITTFLTFDDQAEEAGRSSPAP